MTTSLGGLAVVATLTVVIACSDDGPRSPESALASVVRISTQRCDEPRTFAGYGVDVDGYIVTAAHLIDGELHHVHVDGTTAQVLAIDDRADLAVLHAPDAATAPARSGRAIPTVEPGDTAWMIASAGVTNHAHDEDADDDSPATVAADSTQPASNRDDGRLKVVPVRVERETRLVVNDVSSGDRFERNAIVFSPRVDRGASGAAIVNAGGELIGVVVLSSRSRDHAYAVRVDEVARLLERRFPAVAGLEAALCEQW